MNYKFLISILFLLFSAINSNAQVCQPNDPYDQIISDFHSTVARKPDGKWMVWGERKSVNGNAHIFSPLEINSTNFPGLTGNVLLATVSSSSGGKTQLIILTTNGLYVLGEPDIVFPSNNTGLTKLTINSQADGLPPGINPIDVDKMISTYKSIAILTKKGEVWIYANASPALRTGVQTGINKWYPIVKKDGTVLTNVVQLRMSYQVCFAVDKDNNWYTWGYQTWDGINTSAATVNYANLITKPSGVDFQNDLPLMIGVTSSTANLGSNYLTAVTYFTLSKSGNLYSLGSNLNGLTTTNQDNSVWARVKKNSTELLTDIKYLSVQEHDKNFQSIAVIDKSGTIYTWGQNDFAMIGSDANDLIIEYPTVPNGFTPGVDKATYLELGGHTLIYSNDNVNRFCYVGHKVNGSMGDGTNTDITVSSMDCTNTPILSLCSACPKIKNNSITGTDQICLGESVNTIIGSVVEFSTSSSEPLYLWYKKENQINYSAITNSNTKNYLPSTLTTSTTYMRLVKDNLRQDCPYDSSNNLLITVNPIPSTPNVLNSIETVCENNEIIYQTEDNSLNNATFTWLVNNQVVSNTNLYTFSALNKNREIKVFAEANSCTSDTFTFIAKPILAAPSPFKTSIIEYCQDQNVLFNIDSISKSIYSWEIATNDPSTSYSDLHKLNINIADVDSIRHEGTYKLTIIDSMGCVVNYTYTLVVNDCTIKNIVLPEGFSPNNDGLNDAFVIQGIEQYSSNEITIMNRWGNVVFKESPYKNNWTGQSNSGISVGNGVLPEGTYYYILKLADEKAIKGTIYLRY